VICCLPIKAITWLVIPDVIFVQLFSTEKISTELEQYVVSMII